MQLRIKQERIVKGWSNVYVAKQVGITIEAIRLIENNKRKPSYNVLVKLENLFNLSHRELFREIDD